MSFENNIKKMFSEFDEGQKDWFRFDLPDFIYEWIQGGFNGKQLSRNPALLEDYLENSSTSAAMKIGLLDNLLIAMWCVRKCHGPIHAPVLRRLTKIPNLGDAKSVTIRAKDLLKPVTSWTSNTKVVVEDRNPSDSDYVIQTVGAPESKFVLMSMDVMDQFLKIVIKDFKHFGLDQKQTRKSAILRRTNVSNGKDRWTSVHSHLQTYMHEKEFVLYLHPHESFKADVVEYVENPYKKKAKPMPQKPLSADKQKVLDKLKALKNSQPAVKVDPLNPFNSPLAAVNKLTPKEQFKSLMALYKKTKKIPYAEQRTEEMRVMLIRMKDYARDHDIDLK